MSIPKGVICLISALAFHGLTTQIPHRVYVALPIHAEKPRLEYPPIRLFWRSEKTYSAGIETHTLDGIAVRIFALEKTIADCFKFRNKVGLDVAVEALRDYRKRGISTSQHYCITPASTVWSEVIKPYLEAIL